MNDETRALLALLAIGERELREGKTRPADVVIEALRAKLREPAR